MSHNVQYFRNLPIYTMTWYQLQAVLMIYIYIYAI
jgi:hypothetical protein